MNHNGIFSLSFPEAKTIIVSGDIHGNFNQLVFKLCIQYQLTDTLLIVAGDCGFGFEKKEYYEQIVRRNAKRMNQANNWIVFVRGNHDNPAYFDGAMLNFKRFVAVPDYWHYKIFCVNGNTGFRNESRIFYFIHLQNEEAYERKESSSA